MGIKYDNAEDTTMRLGECVVLHNSIPYYCRSGYMSDEGVIKLNCVNMPGYRGEKHIPLDDPGLNYQDYKLGYLNLADGAHYMMRMPRRRTKQGLNRENMTSSNGGRVELASAMKSQGFYDMLTGSYPTMADACKQLVSETNRAETVAFNRRFALGRDSFRGDFLMYYKGERIAFGDMNSIVLPTDYYHLKEAINQVGINVK